MTENNEWKAVKNAFWKKNKIGDNIFGTLISVREIKSQISGKENELVKIYEIKADGGSFHDTDDKKQVIEPAIVINAGDIWNVGGGSKESPSMLDQRFRNIKLGQKVKIEFTGEQAAKKKGFNPLKIVEVFTNGKMDEEFLKELQGEKAKDDFGDFRGPNQGSKAF